MNEFEDFILPMFLMDQKEELDRIVARVRNGESISANLTTSECEYVIKRLKEYGIYECVSNRTY